MTKKCPVCEQPFPTEIAMRQHFNDKHRQASAQAVDRDGGPDSLIVRGAVPKARCGNCRYIAVLAWLAWLPVPVACRYP